MDKRNIQVIQNIIEEIEQSSRKNAYWAISVDRLIEITRLAPHRFRSYLLKTRKKINMPIDVIIFSNNNPEDLISLLESMYGNIVENEFEMAGIFLPYKTRIELNEHFIKHINIILETHVINYEDFEAMLYGTNTFIEALDIYYNEEFNIDNIISKVGKLFLSTKSYKINKLAKKNIIKYLHSLFDRNILTKKTMFYLLEVRLREFALSKNLYKEAKQKYNDKYYQQKKNTSSRNRKHYEQTNIKMEQAKQIMGLMGNPNLVAIKKKYKSLMKIYHPDINPKGLEKAQQINHAYAILTSYYYK